MKNAANSHLVIVVGGTGGHFFPALEVAAAFREKGGAVTFVISGHNKTKYQQIAQDYDFNVISGKCVRLPSSPLLLPLFVFRTVSSIAFSWKQLRSLRPSVVLGMGSFITFPFCCAAGLSRKMSLVLHEGNALAGKTNRILSKWALRLCASFPLANQDKLHCPVSYTGFPLRRSLVSFVQQKDGYTKEEFCSEFGLAPGKPTVLVFGGSQGAKAVNALFEEASSLLQNAEIQFLHITGANDKTSLECAYAEANIGAKVLSWVEEMEKAYFIADLVVCRAGASTLAELALFGKTAVLIPLPIAAEDHQRCNARMLSRSKGIVEMSEHEATPQKMAVLIRDRFDSPEVWLSEEKDVENLADTHAAEKITAVLRNELPLADG